jgi:hypothetical protein
MIGAPPSMAYRTEACAKESVSADAWKLKVMTALRVADPLLIVTLVPVTATKAAASTMTPAPPQLD